MRGWKTIILVLGLLPFVSQSQRSYYLLADCKDSLVIASLFWDDTVTSRHISSPFVLQDHLAWLEPPVFIRQNIWYENNGQLICLSQEQRDSIIHLPSMHYILYETGSIQQSVEAREIDKKYSIYIERIGCEDSYEMLIDYHNHMMEKILCERNGQDWKERYDNEVKANLPHTSKKR